MDNLVLHISLPAGMKTISGAALAEPVTFDVVSNINPYYCSVDQVRLNAGPILRKLQDIAIAFKIYDMSCQADTLLLRKPVAGDDAIRFNSAVNQWVSSGVARDLLLSTNELYGTPITHVLANFSVTREAGNEGEGLAQRILDLKQQVKQNEITIRSAGKLAPGGHVKPGMAAKGVNDWSQRTLGRTWTVTGMGANSSTGEGVTGNGGRYRPIKMFASPFIMGPLCGFRNGIYQAGSPLNARYYWGTGIDTRSTIGIC